MSDTLIKKVELALDEIRSFLNEDGGDIKVVKIEDYNVYIEFIGNCENCDMNITTLNGVKLTIQKYIPEIKKVIDINNL